ncbi:MAG: hypothetical protein ABUT20_45630 [Bacteroidota bacterium]
MSGRLLVKPVLQNRLIILQNPEDTAENQRKGVYAEDLPVNYCCPDFKLSNYVKRREGITIIKIVLLKDCRQELCFKNRILQPLHETLPQHSIVNRSFCMDVSWP